jgi:sugar/nucleoside kinase (ribokinase family)
MSASPDLLVIGHICHDKVPGGHAPGGAAAYASLLAHRSGQRTCALTSFGNDFQFASQFEGIGFEVVPSATTTLFENIYQPDGQRVQYLHGRAAPLAPAHLPKAWHAPRAALLGPICDEVSLDFLRFFASQNTVTCACPQGWMRQWDDASRRISPKPGIDWQAVTSADIVSMSEADAGGDWSLIARIASLANLLLVTQGAQGATVFERGQPGRHYAARPVQEVDPTGAGDVFAAAFTLRFAEGKDVAAAVQHAHAAAGASVTGKGLAGVPWAADLEGS